MMQIKFSVLICVYINDRADYFEEAFESILNQSLLPDQIVLVIDGPITESLEGVISCFKLKLDKKINIEFTIVRFEKNVGHGCARRRGVLACENDFVAIADADDINDIDRFYKQVCFFEENHEVSIIGSQIIEINNKTKEAIGFRRVPCKRKDILTYMKTRCPFNQMSVMFRREHVLCAGNYVDFYHNEDYYLWVRMHLKGYFFSNLSEALVKVRVDDGFYNRRGGVRYFLSEIKLQGFMFKNNIINMPLYASNCVLRFFIQVLMPQILRGIIFRVFFRRACK